jgi:hypothetical protein
LSLSLRNQSLHRNYIKRDPIMGAVRKRLRDIGVGDLQMHVDQKIHVSAGGDIREDIAHLAQVHSADLVLVSASAHLDITTGLYFHLFGIMVLC